MNDGKLTPAAAVDFDGTICENAWPEIGEEKPGMIEWLKAWKAGGNKLILWTNRTDEKLDAAVEWCAERGIEFDAVNENLQERIDRFGGDTRKISADYYIDDKNAVIDGVGPDPVTLSVGGVPGMNGAPAETMMTGGNRMKERYVFRADMKLKGDTAEVMLYSSIGADKFWGDEYTPEDFDREMKNAREQGAVKLNLRINSPGGDVFSAVAMRSMIINAGFEEVRIMIEGLCASAATLFATVPGARVVIAGGSEFMIHNPMTVAFGNADEIEKTVEHLRSMEGTFREMYASKCGKSDEQIKAWMDAETWFTAARAVEEGFCDELLESEPMAACVSAREMAAMCAMYRNVPKEIGIRAEEDPGEMPEVPEMPEEPEEPENVSNDDPVAGLSTEIQNKEESPEMEIRDLTREQLLAENPALVDEIVNQAVADERARVSEIDSLTMPGFEADAAEAKANGTSAVDFVRTIAAKARQKGAAFMEARAAETAPAAEVAAGAAEEEAPGKAADISAAAQRVADKVAEKLKAGNI